MVDQKLKKKMGSFALFQLSIIQQLKIVNCVEKNLIYFKNNKLKNFIKFTIYLI